MSADPSATGTLRPRLPGGPAERSRAFLSTRGQRGTIVVMLTVLVAFVLAACGTSTTTGALVTDATTLRIAKVEAERLCAIGEMSFPQESGIGADLVERLEAAGLTHEQWATWHAQLAASPELVSQYEAEQETACPEADEAEPGADAETT